MKRVHPFEEALYEQVASELSSGHIRKGLWLKATVESGGNKHKAKSLYTQFRIAQLIDEIAHDAEARKQHQSAAATSERDALVEELKRKNYAVEEKQYGAWVLYEPSGDCKRFSSFAELAAHATTVLGCSQ